MLLARGADFTSRGKDGIAPQHLACARGGSQHVAVLRCVKLIFLQPRLPSWIHLLERLWHRLLLERGANAALPNAVGQRCVELVPDSAARQRVMEEFERVAHNRDL